MKVLLADNQTMVREGLRCVLESAGMEVDEAATLDEAVARAEDSDVVVAGLRQHDVRIDEIVRRIDEAGPDVRVLVLSAVDSPMEVHAAFSAGAKGYLLKDATGQDLVEAVRAVGGGQGYLQPVLGASLARWREGAGSADGDGSALSARQQQVLRMIAIGHTNAEVAQALGVSLRTIEAHRGNIMRKLDLRTRAELVRYAAKHHLVDFSEN